MNKPKNIDEYILTYPVEAQPKLQQLREIIKALAPQATEVISYSMPAFKLHGMLVWFGAHTNHIGFYPRASAIETFKKQLSVYKWAKGSVQFPLDKPLPVELIVEMVKFRITENLQRIKISKK